MFKKCKICLFFQVHVNREFFILFSIFDENLSWYIDDSIKAFAPHKAKINKNDEAFKHGNLIHGMLYTWYAIIQLLPLSEVDMTICSPEAGNIARGRSPSAI